MYAIRSYYGEAAFVDAGTTVANMGLQAQANVLAAANQGRQIDAEELRLKLEHLDKVIHDPEADQFSKNLARIRYNKLLKIESPEEQSSAPPKPQIKSSWETAPYMRGRSYNFV